MKRIDLLNKRILYVGPTFFHYDKTFIKKLEDLGANVDSFDLYPKSLQYKALKRFNHSALENYFDSYFNNMLLNGDYDLILVRHGFQLTIDFLKRLRKVNPHARFLNFHWDSIRPDYNYVPLIKYFDKVFSFDYKDCETYNVTYLPLYYLDEYAEPKKDQIEPKKEFDMLFIGTWRKDRYDAIKLTDKICKENNLSFYYYLNCSFRAQLRSLRKGILPKEAKNKYLSHQEILKYFSNSSNILDLPGSFQTGLTIRTFETLAAGKKLITSNTNIINEPFYNPEYINVINPQNLKLDIDFIKNKPVTSMEHLMENYSIGNYIYKLLEE